MYYLEVTSYGRIVWKGKLPTVPRLGDKLRISSHEMVEIKEVVWHLDELKVNIHGQEFGFTREDVKRLRQEWEDEWSGVSEPNNGTFMLDLADRIEALLPPEVDYLHGKEAWQRMVDED
jgi:hypothetical protein